MGLAAVPDTDGELAHHLVRLEEVLLQLQAYEPDDEPAPIGMGGDALAGVQRIVGEVLRAERAPTPMLVTSGGTFKLVPLRFVDLDDADLAAVGQAIAALGLALLPAGDERAAEVLREFADGDPIDLVGTVARAHGAIDLAADDDTRLLAARISGEMGRIVLSVEEEEAYKRLTERVLAVFHLSDPLARFLYRPSGPG